jgi:r-opsin
MYGSIWIIPPLLGWNRFIFEGFGTTCTFDYISKNVWDRLYVMILVTGGFLIPLLIIIVSYTFILIKISRRSRCLMNNDDQNYELELRKQTIFYSHPTNSFNDGQSRSESTLEPNQNNQITGNLLRTEARVTRTALLVCVIYCTAWGPYALMAILSQIGFTYCLNVYTTAMLSLFTKTAACINALIYAFSSSTFHRQICLCVNSILPNRERFHPLSSSNCDLK